MEQTDYDMRLFRDQIAYLRNTLHNPSWEIISKSETTYYKEDTKKNECYCTEFSFSTAQELYALLDRFLTVQIEDVSKRAIFIRTCLAACYKYAGQGQSATDVGKISEFIYEF